MTGVDAPGVSRNEPGITKRKARFLPHTASPSDLKSGSRSFLDCLIRNIRDRERGLNLQEWALNADGRQSMLAPLIAAAVTERKPEPIHFIVGQLHCFTGASGACGGLFNAKGCDFTNAAIAAMSGACRMG